MGNAGFSVNRIRTSAAIEARISGGTQYSHRIRMLSADRPIPDSVQIRSINRSVFRCFIHRSSHARKIRLFTTGTFFSASPGSTR